MTDSERFALAARLYTALKRSTGRVIDVLWLLQDAVYAREVMRLASAADAECTELANKLSLTMTRDLRQAASPPSHAATGVFPSAPAAHYVRGLR